MDKQKRLDIYIHHVMSVVGGFLGGYAIINRFDTFGSSETSNMIHIMLALLGSSMHDFLIRVVALLIYIIGIELTVFLPRICKLNMRLFSVIVDMLTVVVIAFLPAEMNFLVALYPVFFATAVQWNVFATTNTYFSATIFSTNNLRQTAISYGEYICTKDKAVLKKGRFFAATLLCYHIGVVYVYYSSRFWGLYGALTCLLPLLIALSLVIYEQRLLSRGENSDLASAA